MKFSSAAILLVPLSFTLPSDVSPHPSSPLVPVHLIGSDLGFNLPTDANEDRNLQSICDDQVLEDVAEMLLSQFYSFGFSCSCTAGSTYTITCNSNGQACCGDICGTMKRVIEYSFMLDPISEQGCITYASGAGALIGKTVCITAYYTGMTLTSCDTTIGGTACTACTVCGSLPGSSDEIQYAASDCANVEGGDLISYECGDLDTIHQELEALSLMCSGGEPVGLSFAAALGIGMMGFPLYFYM